MSLNKVIMVGRITADPELKVTQNGKNVTSFSIAINRGKNIAEFFNVAAWGSTAEFVCKYFHKGDGIAIDGRLSSRTWEKDGVKRVSYDIVADAVNFVEASREKPQGETGAERENASPTKPFAYSRESDVPKFEDISSDNDLPY